MTQFTADYDGLTLWCENCNTDLVKVHHSGTINCSECGQVLFGGHGISLGDPMEASLLRIRAVSNETLAKLDEWKETVEEIAPKAIIQDCHHGFEVFAISEQQAKAIEESLDRARIERVD